MSDSGRVLVTCCGDMLWRGHIALLASISLHVVALVPSMAAPAGTATVHLSTHNPPRLLLAGVEVPVPFGLRAAGIECGTGLEDANDCLLVEAVLDHPTCPREQMVSTAKACDKGESRDVSIAKDCGVLKHTIKMGTGGPPPIGAKVTAHYTGRLENGNKFDSSRDRNEPFSFTLGAAQVIRCWDEAFAAMSKGEQAVITCMAPYAYGARGIEGVIPGGATLIFDVELLSWERGADGDTKHKGVSEVERGKCGRVLGSKRVSVTTLTEEDAEVMVMVAETGVYNLHLRVRLAGNQSVLATEEVRGVRVVPAFLCMAPAIVIVFMAVYTKNVVLALMSGLTVGGTVVSGYNPVLGFLRGGDTFLYDAVQQADQVSYIPAYLERTYEDVPALQYLCYDSYNTYAMQQQQQQQHLCYAAGRRGPVLALQSSSDKHMRQAVARRSHICKCHRASTYYEHVCVRVCARARACNVGV